MSDLSRINHNFREVGFRFGAHHGIRSRDETRTVRKVANLVASAR